MPRAGVSLHFPAWEGSVSVPPIRSYWVEQALEQEKNVSVTKLEGSLKADICIVGGGFTGLWTAYRILESDPSASVCIVEADLCGSGASGRNSGAAGHWYSRAPGLVQLFGDQDALTVMRAAETGVADIETFIGESGADCGLRHVSSVWSQNLRGQQLPWEATLRTLDRLNVAPPFERVSPEGLEMMFGKAPFYGAVLSKGNVKIQPASLARTLRSALVASGCQVFERSPVVRIESRADHVEITTSSGRVQAAQVVLGANAWMAHLHQFRPHVHVTSSDIIVTDPIPQRLKEAGIADRPGGINSRQMLNYWGYTPEGRVLVGRGGGAVSYNGHVKPEFHFSPKRAKEVEKDFHLLFPELSDIPAARTWGGPIDRSTTGLPFFGRLIEDDRISFGIGYTGHGVGATALGGRILASLALGKKNEWTDLQRTLDGSRNRSYPPEPFRYVGGATVRNAIGRKERSEMTGGKPSALDRRLAKLALFTLPGGRKKTA